MPADTPVKIRKATGEDTSTLVEIWAEAVAATHQFLTVEEIEYYRRLIPGYLSRIEVFVAENAGNIKGFSGIAGDKVEMLFVGERGTGTGSALLNHAVNEMGVTKVDVNEENPQAAGFYRSKGFAGTGRSPLDGEGKPHPIIHMELISAIR